MNNSDIHGYQTRNRSNLRNIYCKYTKSQKNMNYMSVMLYNKLPVSFKNLTLNKFKKELKHILIKNCFYKVEDFLTFNFQNI